MSPRRAVLLLALLAGVGPVVAQTVPAAGATMLGLELDQEKELKSLTVRALANDVVIGLMAATLER